MDEVTHKHFKATAYLTTEMDNCSAKHSRCNLRIVNFPTFCLDALASHPQCENETSSEMLSFFYG